MEWLVDGCCVIFAMVNGFCIKLSFIAFVVHIRFSIFVY